MISINYAFILVILNFILLLIVLNKILYKPIKKFLIERQKKIASDMNNAEASRQEAEKLVQKKNDELKASAEDVRKMKKAAKRDADSQAVAIMKNAKDQEKKILKGTEEQLVHEKEKVMKEIEGELTEMVTNLSAKFLSEKVNDKNDRDLIKKMLTEREDK